MDPFDDSMLWDAYEAAVAGGDDPRPHAARIVEFHLGFIRDYAKRTIWPSLDMDEYVSELVVIALGLVPRFDRSHRRDSGKAAAFIVFLRPYLQETRWKMVAANADLPTGKETRRLLAAAQQCIREHESLGLPEPTPEQLDAYVSARLGKKVGTARIERALAMPVVERGDADASIDDGRFTAWEKIADATPSLEDQVIAAEEERVLSSAVAAALVVAELSEVDKALVAERLMVAPRRVLDGVVVSPGPTPYRVLAERYGLTVAGIKSAEDDLSARLRDLLADFA